MSAEGAKIETPQAPREWGLGRGLHPQPIKGSMERRKHPQRGPVRGAPGQTPATNSFGIFKA